MPSLRRYLSVICAFAMLFYAITFYAMTVLHHETTDTLFESSSIGSSTTNSDTENLPLFILHVGPKKTGTTTLQSFASKHQDLLEKDNIYFLGYSKQIHGEEGYEYCRTWYFPCSGNWWGKLERKMRHHHSLNHNVMLSEEMFSEFQNNEDEDEYLWNRLAPFLINNWRLRVIFTYRRYDEWLVSTYHRWYNPDHDNEERRQHWPDNGGHIIPTFSKFISWFTVDYTYHLPQHAKRKWDDHFSNISIFNMHSDGDMIGNFVCQMLPEAKRLCDFRRDPLNKAYYNVNPSSSGSSQIPFDMLAVAAYRRGWVNTSLTRPQVREAVERRSKELNISNWIAEGFPVKCPSNETIASLLNESLSYESQMVPDFHASERGEKELRIDFAEAVKKGMFCSLDVDSVLKDEDWKRFFKSLGSAAN